MEETLPRVEPESTGSNESVSAQRRSRWTQTHTIWLLMVLSLLPGLVVAFDRELWTGLPAGIRGQPTSSRPLSSRWLVGSSSEEGRPATSPER
jgi:hypothetical protein